MFFFSQNKKIKNIAYLLFTKIVDQARKPFFYTDWMVSDNVDGRFDLIILHLSLLINRLEAHDKDKKIALLIRYIQEALFDNMDMSLREMGVGDMSVGKKVKAMAEAFYGRKMSYTKAFLSEDKNFALNIKPILVRNIYRENTPDDIILNQFAAYIKDQAKYLESQSENDIMTAEIFFKEML
ncbi:MAG: hypothetical protein K9G26_07295 [Emcibacter sp.]|nr:hypothetical protein [Emcibacter sp.]